MLTKRLLKVALHATVVLAAATGVAQEPSRPAHLFMEVSLSPDARCVAAVEGDTSPAWTRDSRKFSFALRDPETHARSIYQVNADGGGLTRLIAFNGTIQALRYSADGQLAMLAVESAANVRDFGHGDLDDILAGVDAVAALGLTDPERVGITGHSYGGFMTMWAVTQTDRVKAADAGAGISNWQSYYGQNGIDEWMVRSLAHRSTTIRRCTPGLRPSISSGRCARQPSAMSGRRILNESYEAAADPSVNFQAQITAITSTGMNAAKTQNAAALAALNEMPSASPEELATMPAAAVPTA